MLNDNWHIVIDVYHEFPTKGISAEMLKEAHKRSGLDLSDCKRIIEDYINDLEYGTDLD